MIVGCSFVHEERYRDRKLAGPNFVQFLRSGWPTFPLASINSEEGSCGEWLAMIAAGLVYLYTIKYFGMISLLDSDCTTDRQDEELDRARDFVQLWDSSPTKTNTCKARCRPSVNIAEPMNTSKGCKLQQKLGKYSAATRVPAEAFWENIIAAVLDAGMGRHNC
ncbi:hypothetical protein FB451DRAFT_1367133 [Mycena latifolia]|nr:hypothetical protein FB451DRAFT_1367133 [Mycena latifolia]